MSLISLKHVIFRDTHARDHKIKTLFENCLVRDKSVIINDPNIPGCALS